MTDEQLLNNYDVYLKLTKTKKIYIGICQKGKEISRTDKTSWTKNWTYNLEYSNSKQKYVLYHNGLGYNASAMPEYFRKIFECLNTYITNIYLKQLLNVNNCFKIKVDDMKLIFLKMYLKEFVPNNIDEYEMVRISVKDFISCPPKIIEKTEQNISKTNNNNNKLFLLI